MRATTSRPWSSVPSQFSGDGGAPADAALNRPAGLDFDADGRLYIADTYNHRIRRASLP